MGETTIRQPQDASVALAWCFEDEATNWTEEFLERLRQGDRIIVPAHWATEVANALLMGVRRRSEEHTSELQSRLHIVCRLLLEKKKKRVVYNYSVTEEQQKQKYS